MKNRNLHKQQNYYLSQNNYVIENQEIDTVVEFSVDTINQQDTIPTVDRSILKPVFEINDTSFVSEERFDQQNPFFRYIRNNHVKYYDWILIIFLFIMLVFSIVRRNSVRYISQIFGSLVNYQLANKMFRDITKILPKLSAIFLFINNMIFSVFVYEIFDHYNYSLVHYKLLNLLIIFIYIGVFAMARYIILRIAGFIFAREKEFNEYLFNISIFNQGIGIILFPVVAIFPFSPDFLKFPLLILGAVILILMNGLRFYRGLKIILSKGILISYLILYFCTFEILPLLLLYKVTHLILW